MKERPYLKKKEDKIVLMVDQAPFFIRGGELHNSSSSSEEHMNQFVWPCLKPLHMNTVLSPVCWEQIEPQESAFDFSEVDRMLKECRREGMKWIPLWFGLWKNGASEYVPVWMKKQPEKYIWSRDIYGKSLSTISPLGEKAVEADARAFAAFMAHIREVDADNQTVLMVQVENEVGLMGSDRDYGELAEKKFECEIPEIMQKITGKSGKWKEVFKDQAGEKFIAYYFAKAVEKIAAAGKKEYNLPMFVNTFLQMDFMIPGMYPSGGPLVRNLPIWKAAAPAIDIFCPDIYSDNFQEIADSYVLEDTPLFIPEAAGTVKDAAYVFYIVGKHNALGFSPFGIETMFGELAEDKEIELNKMDNTMPLPQHDIKPGPLLARAYEIIDSMYDKIQTAHEAHTIQSFIKQNNIGCILRMKNCLIRIKYKSGSTHFQTPDMFGGAMAENPDLIAGGFIIEENENEFIIAGTNFYLEFLPIPGSKALPYVLSKEEGRYVDGEWTTRRRMNGDERNNHNIGIVPRVMKMKIMMHD